MIINKHWCKTLSYCFCFFADSEDGRRHPDRRPPSPDNIPEENKNTDNVAKLKQNFSFRIQSEEWNTKITIKKDKRGDRYLGGQWTNVFHQNLKTENKTCTLVIKGNKVKRGNEKVTAAPFFSGKAECKFKGCVKYEMVINTTPVTEEHVKVNVATVPPSTEVRHDVDMNISKPLCYQRGDEHQTASNVFYKRFGNISDGKHDAGNSSGSRSKSVLQKISLKKTLARRLHQDVSQELALQN